MAKLLPDVISIIIVFYTFELNSYCEYVLFLHLMLLLHQWPNPTHNTMSVQTNKTWVKSFRFTFTNLSIEGIVFDVYPVKESSCSAQNAMIAYTVHESYNNVSKFY